MKHPIASTFLITALIAAGLTAWSVSAQTTAPPAVRPTPYLPDIPEMGVHRGKPDLGGKGAWDLPHVVDMAKARAGVEKAQEVPFKPNGQALFDQRVETLAKDDPEGYCLPPGIPRMMYTPYPAEILQLPDRVVFLYEGGAHVWRIVWMDGRQHPKDPNPTFLGDSIGHWEGDVLVIDVVGFNENTWLDNAGHPHGEKLHVIERYSRPNFNTLHYEATIEDPDFYTKPWTVPMNIKWHPGQVLMEYICQENNQDVPHLVGK